MFQLKMKGNFHEDVKIVDEAISYLSGMLETLEKECIEHDKGKSASDMFIFISNMKRDSDKMVENSKRLVRSADIDQYGGWKVNKCPFVLNLEQAKALRKRWNDLVNHRVHLGVNH